MHIKNKPLCLLVVGSVATATLSLESVAEDKVAIQVQNYQENGDRVDIQDGKFSFEHDFGPDHTLNVEVDWDSISGASPTWDSKTGASQIVSSASVDSSSGASPCIDEDGEYLCRDTYDLENSAGGEGYKSLNNDEISYKTVTLEDHRDSIAFLYTFRTPVMRNEISVGASYSKEGDFINSGASAEYLMYTNRSKNTGLTIGASFMKNEVLDYIENQWNTYNLYNAQIGVTQVFNASMVAKINAYYMLESGHLSNPYFNVVRRLNVSLDESEPVNLKNYLFKDSRPNLRKAGGISAQLVSEINSHTQWHLSYRYYQDSWAVASNTLESKSLHALSNRFRFSIGLRYYQQDEASFFKAHDSADNIFDEHGYASADHRLGHYDSITGQLSLEFLQTSELTWNIVAGHQKQSSGLEFAWVNLGAQYHY